MPHVGVMCKSSLTVLAIIKYGRQRARERIDLNSAAMDQKRTWNHHYEEGTWPKESTECVSAPSDGLDAKGRNKTG